jgi:hypothetical protein
MQEMMVFPATCRKWVEWVWRGRQSVLRTRQATPPMIPQGWATAKRLPPRMGEQARQYATGIHAAFSRGEKAVSAAICRPRPLGEGAAGYSRG